MAKGTVNHQRVIGKRDPMIYGHFLEHFHRQIYGESTNRILLSRMNRGCERT